MPPVTTRLGLWQLSVFIFDICCVKVDVLNTSLLKWQIKETLNQKVPCTTPTPIFLYCSHCQQNHIFVKRKEPQAFYYIIFLILLQPKTSHKGVYPPAQRNTLAYVLIFEKKITNNLSHMMTSSNGNIFKVTGHLCGEFTGEFPPQRPVTRSFDVLFDLRLNKQLSKQS